MKRPPQSDLELEEVPDALQQQLVCYQCGTTQTPQWREGPQGPKTLCNACGVRAYRQAKRSRKGGAHGGSARSSLQRQRGSTARRSSHLHGDSGDELTVTYCTMSDHSTEDSEEQLAALSLLCFAGLQPVGAEGLEEGDEGLEEGLAQDAEEDGEDGVQPAQGTELPMESEHQQPSAAGIKEEVPTAAGVTSERHQAPLPGVPLFIAQLPTAELACLQQLQGAVQHAFREVQAAEAAMVAVAQFLREKEAQARSARERARLAECVLLEQMRQLDEQFQLSRQLRQQQQRQDQGQDQQQQQQQEQRQQEPSAQVPLPLQTGAPVSSTAPPAAPVAALSVPAAVVASH